MRRSLVWGAAILLLLCSCLGAILVPVFKSAKVAAEGTRQLSLGRSFSQAMAKYVDTHSGKLAGKDWRTQAERIDPRLRGKLSGIDGIWHVGFAAIPGTLGKKLEQLPPETVLFVGYRSSENMDILKDVFDIGYAPQEGRAIEITADHIRSGGHARFLPSVNIAYHLGRQGAIFK